MFCDSVFASHDFAKISDAKKMYLAFANTIKKTLVHSICVFKFRNVAELFYFVMFPCRCGEGVFIQNINNICKSTVNK